MPDEITPAAPVVPPHQQTPIQQPAAAAPTVVDDDDEPEEPAAPQEPERVRGRGGVLPDVAISDVRARERRKLLREEYGTTDEKRIAEIRAEREETKRLAEERGTKLSTYEQQEAERKRASMSEVDQLKADLAAANARIQTLEQERDRAVLTAKSSQQMTQVERAAAAAKVKAKFMSLLSGALATHYNGLSKLEKKMWSAPNTAAKQLERFVQRWAKENPECIEAAPVVDVPKVEPEVPAPAPKAEPKPAAPIRRLLGNARPPAPAPKPAPITNKGPGVNELGRTVKPGKGAMSHEELDAHLAKQGRKLPYAKPAPSFGGFGGKR